MDQLCVFVNEKNIMYAKKLLNNYNCQICDNTMHFDNKHEVDKDPMPKIE